MSAARYRSLLHYDAAMNRRLLGVLRELPGDVAEARRLLAHLLAARTVWRLRLQGEDTSALAIWPDRSWDECEARLDEDEAAYEAWFDVLTDADDLDRVATYRNSKGVRYETAVRDVLQHLVVHGGHHRGQLARIARERGATPPVLDYVFYVREEAS